jgi:hypothetical protein
MQLAYNTEPAAGRIGQLSDSGDNDIVSRYSAAKIPFGRFVSFDTVGGKVKLPAAATDIINGTSYAVLEGVAIEDPSVESKDANTLGVSDANAPAHDIADAIPVLKRGRVIVWSEQAVSPTDAVFVRHTVSTDGLQKCGNVRKDLDTDKASSLGEKAHFVGTTTGAGLVEIDVRL